MMNLGDKNGCPRNLLLDFVRFPTPHNGQKSVNILFEMLSHRNLLGKVKDVTTNNASDMVSAIERLSDLLNIDNNSSGTVNDLHIRCLAHILNLAVKDCLTDVHIQIGEIHGLLSAMSS